MRPNSGWAPSATSRSPGGTEQDGQWVRWDDVQRLTEIAGDNAVRLDLFHRTLVEIATVPLSIPNSVSAGLRLSQLLLTSSLPVA